MIDIRDHGGSFGGNKYRKGYIFSPEELGIKLVLNQDLLVHSTDMVIEDAVMDEDRSIWTCGYSSSSGARYMAKSVWESSINYLSYRQVLSVSGLNQSEFPSQLLLIPGQSYVYMNDGVFKRYNKNTGVFINAFSRYFNSVSLSSDGKYIYGYDSSTRSLYKLNHDLSIVAQINTVPPYNTNTYTFIDGRYFIMYNYATFSSNGSAGYRNVLYDMETMTQIAHPTQNQTDMVQGSPMNITIFGSYLYKVSGQYIYKYRLSDMYMELSVRVLTGSYDSLVGIYDYDSEHFGVFYVSSTNTPRVLRLLKKSDLLTFVNLPYGFKIDYSIKAWKMNKKTNEHIYASTTDGTWKLKGIGAGLTIQ